MKKNLLFACCFVLATVSFAAPTVIDCGDGRGTIYLADDKADADAFKEWYCKKQSIDTQQTLINQE